MVSLQMLVLSNRDGLFNKALRYTEIFNDVVQLHQKITGIVMEALKAENVQLKEENGELKQAVENPTQSLTL